MEKTELKPKNIYQVTKEDINQNLEKYGLKGKVKSVSQTTVYLPKDSVIDVSKYKVFDRNEDKDYPWLAEMDNDCRLDFDKDGKLIKRKSFGKRFGSESVNIDSLIYDKNGSLVILRNRLEGDDFDFAGDMKFEYNNAGHLVKQYVHQQTWSYNYIADKNQVDLVHYEDKSFRFRHKYTYNTYGQKVELQSLNEDGSLETRTAYKYDDRGEVEKEIWHYKNGKEEELLKRKYDKTVKVYKQFDKHENYTIRII
ncbi:MAG: hypothetical protein EOP00_30545, partial [Pedobacter sp.]